MSAATLTTDLPALRQRLDAFADRGVPTVSFTVAEARAMLDAAQPPAPPLDRDALRRLRRRAAEATDGTVEVNPQALMVLVEWVMKQTGGES